jgi:hypothetical protein
VENHAHCKERKKKQKRKKTKKPDGQVENAASILQKLGRLQGVSHFPTGSATTTKL